MIRQQISLGVQDFAKIREAGSFYVDKTSFIKEWWDGADDVTLEGIPPVHSESRGPAGVPKDGPPSLRSAA